MPYYVVVGGLVLLLAFWLATPVAAPVASISGRVSALVPVADAARGAIARLQ